MLLKKCARKLCTACPPLNWIHHNVFQWQFKELANVIDVEMHVLAVARHEVNFQG
jgi:hypothetical protein